MAARGPARPDAARLGSARRDPRHADRYEIVINGAAANAPRNCIFTRIGTIGGPRRSAQFAAANRPASRASDGPIRETRRHWVNKAESRADRPQSGRRTLPLCRGGSGSLT
jgi:hypothetical protein